VFRSGTRSFTVVMRKVRKKGVNWGRLFGCGLFPAEIDLPYEAGQKHREP
jgi:hypothetical protein